MLANRFELASLKVRDLCCLLSAAACIDSLISVSDILRRIRKHAFVHVLHRAAHVRA